MIYDHEAIRRAYPEVTGIADGGAIRLKDGSFVTIGKELDQNSINIAREQLDAEFAATKYQRDRAAEYPTWQDQLDNIYHNGIDAWKADIKKIKDKYPKP